MFVYIPVCIFLYIYLYVCLFVGGSIGWLVKKMVDLLDYILICLFVG